MSFHRLARRAPVGSLSGLVLLAALVAAARPAAAAAVDGLWDAVLVLDGTEVPFRFEIATRGTAADGFFFEGERKVGSTSGTFDGSTLTFEYELLNSTLTLKVEGETLVGTYRNNRAGGAVRDVRARRFVPVPMGDTPSPQVAGDWQMQRKPDEVKTPRDGLTWHLILRQSGAEVTGAILRIDGDTGNLEGHWQGDRLVMSHFAGERPMLFEATLNADGTMAVSINRRSNYLAARSTEARAKGIPEPADPSRYTSVKDPTVPFAFAFPDRAGTLVSNTDARFKGKVVLVAIGGSWCPNCHDEAPFLVELYRDYHERGLEIVGLMFEFDETPAVAWPRIQAFVKRYALPYPMLLAGTTENIGQRLPQLVNFGAYPTAVYLGRDGRVRRVHAGFASAATGKEHEDLKREMRELVERLLAESASSSAQHHEP